MKAFEEIERFVTTLGLRLKQPGQEIELEIYLKCHEMIIFLQGKILQGTSKFTMTEASLEFILLQLDKLLLALNPKKAVQSNEIKTNLVKVNFGLSKIAQSFLQENANHSLANVTASPATVDNDKPLATDIVQKARHLQEDQATNFPNDNVPEKTITPIKTQNIKITIGGVNAAQIKVTSSGNLIQARPIMVSPTSLNDLSKVEKKPPPLNFNVIGGNDFGGQSNCKRSITNDFSSPKKDLGIQKRSTGIFSNESSSPKKLNEPPSRRDNPMSIEAVLGPPKLSEKITESTLGLTADQIQYDELPYHVVLQRKGLDQSSLEVIIY